LVSDELLRRSLPDLPILGIGAFPILAEKYPACRRTQKYIAACDGFNCPAEFRWGFGVRDESENSVPQQAQDETPVARRTQRNDARVWRLASQAIQDGFAPSVVRIQINNQNIRLRGHNPFKRVGVQRAFADAFEQRTAHQNGMQFRPEQYQVAS
jgi:hypothetical protein